MRRIRSRGLGAAVRFVGLLDGGRELEGFEKVKEASLGFILSRNSMIVL